MLGVGDRRGGLIDAIGRGLGGSDAEHHDRRPRERQRVEHEHGTDVQNRQEQPGHHGAEEEADAVDEARGDVRRRELRRVLRQTRQQGRLRRPEGQPDHSDENRQRVHRERRPVGEHHAGRGEDEPGAHHVGTDHQAASIDPVGEHRDERSEHRHRDVPNHAERAECGDASALVGVDRQSNGERPVADDRTDERRC